MNTKPLVIFDLDGLLVETEKLFYKAFKSAAKAESLTLPKFDEYITRVVASGSSVSEVVGLKKVEASEFERNVYDRYEDILNRELKLRTGAIECLKRLDQYHLVLVTGSKKRFSDFILKKTSIKTYFEHIITRDDEFPPKPDPSVFLHLLSEYKIRPWQCIVIEDSKRGITAALAAGIPTIIIPNEYTKREEFGFRVTKVKRLEEITSDLLNRTMESAQPKADHTLVNLYGDSIARLEDTFAIYKDIYGLEDFLHIDEDVSPEAFDYARKRSYFIILAMITQSGKIYLQRSFDTGHLSMLLPGGSIQMEKEEGILNAINRIARKTLDKARLADIAPVALLKNRFVCQDGRIVEHKGLGIKALLLNDDNKLAKYMNDHAIKGTFVKHFDEEEIPQPPSKHTYSMVSKWLENKDYTTYINEIEGQQRVINRYIFHQHFVNPLFKALSYFIGKYSIRDVKTYVTKSLQGANSFLDITCGDDKSIFEALEKVPLVVANDISVEQLKNMEDHYMRGKKNLPKSNAILFTNHDCLDLPFRKNAFDAVICRNTLHHMQSAGDLRTLLSNVRKVAKKIIVVEIQDPAKEGLWGRLRHSYYMKFLKDEGECFYNRTDFETVIEEHFSSDTIKYDYLETIRGVYMAAIIEKRRRL